MEIVVPDEFKYLYSDKLGNPIVKVPSEVLRQPARAIGRMTNRHRMLGENMLRIMRKWHGIGLAAPQLGISERIVVIAPSGMRPTALFNPEVISAEGEEVGEEGCLSLPGLYGEVVRATNIEVKALDRKGNEVVYELEGIAARVALHEIDHLDGVLFIDKVDVTTLHWIHPEYGPDTA